MTNRFDIANSMNNILGSDDHKAIFAKPQLTKTAAKKEDNKEDKKDMKGKDKDKAKKEDLKKNKDKSDAKDKAADKAKADKAKADKAKADKAKADKAKADKAKADKAKQKKKAMNQYQACVLGLAKISETLDNAGFSKAATHTLIALENLVSNADKMPPWLKKDKEEDEEDDKEDKKDEEEDEEEDEEDEDEDEEDDENDVASITFPMETITAKPPVDASKADDDYVREELYPELRDEVGSPEQSWSDEEIEALLAGEVPEDEDLGIEDQDIYSAIEALTPQERVASKKTSLQKLAEELKKTLPF